MHLSSLSNTLANTSQHCNIEYIAWGVGASKTIHQHKQKHPRTWANNKQAQLCANLRTVNLYIK